MKIQNQKGFSLVELTITLVIFGSIVLVVTKIGNDIAIKKRNNVQINIIKNYEDTVIKYLSDNYDFINNNLKNTNKYTIDYSSIVSSYSKFGLNENWDKTSPFGPPCLVFSKDNNTNLQPYLLIPYTDKYSLDIKNKNIMEMRKSFDSDKMGILENINPNRLDVLYGQNPLFSYNPSSDLNNCSGFKNLSEINKANSYKGFIINLSKNSNYVNKISLITDGTNNYGNSEALKSQQNVNVNVNDKTMFSNIYLDAIIKESSAWSTNYCDSTKANQALLTQQCQNYANSTGLRFDGMQQIASINMIGGTCQIQAKANFSTLTSCSPPNNAVSATATGICQSQHPNNYNYVGPTQYNYYTSTPTGGLCKANFQAKFSKQVTSGTCKTYEYTIGYGGGQWGRASCSAGGVYNYPGNCGLTGGTAACDGVTKNGKQGWYGNCTGAVQLGPYNCANAGCAGKDWTCIEYDTTTDYQNYQCATNVSYSADYGASTTMNCGAVYNDSNAYQTNSGVNPPEHKFKSLTLGNNGSASVELRSNSQDGIAATDSTLLVKNAAVKSGFIAPKIRTTNPIAADSSCTAAELGKIAQQVEVNSNYTTSQVVCTYSPDFCGGTGYCYSPLKSQTQTIDLSNVSSAYCPAGTRADPNQISSTNINNYVNNSIICGSGQTQKYSILYDGTKAIGFKSYCLDSYGQQLPIGKITKILCLGAADFHSLTNCKGGTDGKVVCS